MEKDLKGYQLIELLDIKSLLPDYSDKADEDKEAKEVRDKAIAKIYDAIAKKLFNEYHIKKGDATYDFLEIEFYYFDKGHRDYITYPRTISKGNWFFHNSGMDLSFESWSEIGFEKTSEAGENFFGGILIRSLVKDDKTATIGPLKCCWKLFDSFCAFERKVDELPVIERKPVETKHDIYRTVRYIRYDKDKAAKDYGFKNIESYEKHLELPYRYFIKCPVLIELKNAPYIKEIQYSAQPWKTGSKEEKVS